jgi:hypothetical protein
LENNEQKSLTLDDNKTQSVENKKREELSIQEKRLQIILKNPIYLDTRHINTHHYIEDHLENNLTLKNMKVQSAIRNEEKLIDIDDLEPTNPLNSNQVQLNNEVVDTMVPLRAIIHEKMKHAQYTDITHIVNHILYAELPNLQAHSQFAAHIKE